jgi:hypothetical protein
MKRPAVHKREALISFTILRGIGAPGVLCDGVTLMLGISARLDVATRIDGERNTNY